MPAEPLLVAGIDSSTQSCKVVVVDAATGREVRRGRAPHPPGTELDPERWWEALLAAIVDAGGLDDVRAVAFGGQQHGMVALDAEGRIVRPALLWNDLRSAAAATALVDELGASTWVERTGSVPVASFTATKLRWLRDAEPEAAARVAAVALPHDWLTWRFLGHGPGRPALDALTTDRSEASGTSYWNPRTGEYEHELLRHALGHDVAVPTVLAPDARAGVTDGSVPGIPAGIVVGAGAGDNAAAALGLGAGVGDVVVSIGTSGTVFVVTSEHAPDPSGTVAGFAAADSTFLSLVATVNAARVLEAAERMLGVDHDELAELALAAPAGADGLVLVPYLEGERTPNLPDATASITGLTLATATREHIARAAVEGMLCGLAAGLDAVRDLGIATSRVLMVGGGAQNPAVASIASEVFDIPVELPEPAEYVARGAAVQAVWCATGSRPSWQLRSTAAQGRHVPGILRTYLDRAAAVAPRR